MLLTITTTHQPATDLGFLLHKHPDKVQSFSLAAGNAYVFYPEAKEEKCTAALLLSLDVVDLVRKLRSPQNLLKQYVNDRPYVASSFTSAAIAEIFGSALNGKCATRPELLGVKMPFEVSVAVMRVSGGEYLLRKMFEPLGYEIEIERHILDTQFTQWGESRYYSVKLKNTLTIKELLSHLYVLFPVFDNEKHYWVNKEEVEVLLKKGEGWLNSHPEKQWISRRFLKGIGNLTSMAMEGLTDEEVIEAELAEEAIENEAQVEKEKRISLHQQRLDAALEQLKNLGAKKVLDLGCGEGKLLKMMLNEGQFTQILGMDISTSSLMKAKEKLYYDKMNDHQKQRLQLIHGSLTYRDTRLAGFDAAAIIEVIEHLDLDRLTAFERCVFEFAHPKHVIITTPNAEYNVKYETLSADTFRHSDHRFEWKRAEFQAWAAKVCEKFGYEVAFFPIGEEDAEVGASSQMGVFSMKG
ncbi:MAG: 3' terminal RNA ribose 2'-O-methyltransferase Hen1 [Bacteroidia bacterium]